MPASRPDNTTVDIAMKLSVFCDVEFLLVTRVIYQARKRINRAQSIATMTERTRNGSEFMPGRSACVADTCSTIQNRSTAVAVLDNRDGLLELSMTP
jgi:hypothetical protein